MQATIKTIQSRVIENAGYTNHRIELYGLRVVFENTRKPTGKCQHSE